MESIKQIIKVRNNKEVQLTKVKVFINLPKIRW